MPTESGIPSKTGTNSKHIALEEAQVKIKIQALYIF